MGFLFVFPRQTACVPLKSHTKCGGNGASPPYSNGKMVYKQQVLGYAVEAVKESERADYKT